MWSKSRWEWWIFRINIPYSEKWKSCFGTFHLKIKFFFLLFPRNSYLSPIWIFIFATDQAQMYSALVCLMSLIKIPSVVSHNEQLPLCVCVTTLIIIRCLCSLCVNNLLFRCDEFMFFLPNLFTSTVSWNWRMTYMISDTILRHRIYRYSHHHSSAWREWL